jgi:hypothetical protein
MGQHVITIALIVGLMACTSTKSQQSSLSQAAAQPAPQSKASAESMSKQNPAEPEIVRVEKVVNGAEVKMVLVANKNGRYSLSCNSGSDGCETPQPGVDYYVITKDTSWRLQGAEGQITLKFIQDWTGEYNHAENIGLVAVKLADRKGTGLGIYWLNSWTGR